MRARFYRLEDYFDAIARSDRSRPVRLAGRVVSAICAVSGDMLGAGQTGQPPFSLSK